MMIQGEFAKLNSQLQGCRTEDVNQINILISFSSQLSTWLFAFFKSVW
jgi:hypothetical protein